MAGLKPRLKSHLEIHRHHYRGERWYVLQDHSSNKFHRFTPAAHQLIGLMDGKRTVREVWEAARMRLGEDAPTQQEVIQLLGQLHAADALQTDVLPDTAEMLKRFEKRQYGKWKENLRSPLFMRFPLLDPERILVRLWPLVRHIFSWVGAVIWLAVVGCAVFMAGVHWPELTEDIADRVLTPGNLLVMWLMFPFVKVFHEFAHAFAVKKWGGEVHELGVMLMVFTPIPYVDASAAAAFRNKSERILVGAAGIMAELFLASLALFFWANIEPGPMRAVIYNIIIMAGISTLLFNGNPLLRYDAYYILGDLLEIPNLGPRGIRYVLYLLQRYLLGVRDAEEPLSAPGERFWFVVYTIASFIYRIFIYVIIVLAIAGKFFFLGALMACWGVFNMLIMPLGKMLRFLTASPKLRRRRPLAIAVSGLILAAFAGLITLIPVPLSTGAEGVIWVPEDSFVRAGADGFIDRVVSVPGSRIGAGDLLIECSDPLLPAEIRVLESRLEELRAVYQSRLETSRVEAQITSEEIKQVIAALADARKRAGDLAIRAAAGGFFVVPEAQDLPGRFVRRGELVGYVLDRSVIIARVVVSQADVDMVRKRTRDVKIRFPEGMAQVLPAALIREVPAATDQLPSPTLTMEGGGPIPVDPRDMKGIKAFEKIFLFDIRLPAPAKYYNVGGRVHVRFDHGSEPLVWRWYRGIRQLFLKRFNV